MKRLCAFVILLFVAASAMAQCGGDREPATPKLFFVFLDRPASAPTYSKEKSAEIQSGHMANMQRLGHEGKLKLAGPFMDDTTLRGLFVFAASSADEVREWLKTDPAVAAGRLSGDVHPWDVHRGHIEEKIAKDAPMESFVVLVYRPGEKLDALAAKDEEAVWAAHRKYQEDVYASRQSEIAGGFGEGGSPDRIGVTIAHGKKEDGEKLAAADPAVKAGLARVEVHEWITARGKLTNGGGAPFELK